MGKTDVYDDVKGEQTVGQLKERIHLRVGIPSKDQRLVFGGAQLQDGQTLAHYRVQAGSTLHLVIRLLGGGF
ncbi:MAG: ubiquitin [Desulfobacteraceae bacterium]|nr:ubiquitin [Desulfobacteraceae bacterium]